MQSSTITTKGQVTIPVQLRNQFNLQPGDVLEFSTEDNKIVIVKQKDDIRAAFGMQRVEKRITLKDIDEAIEKGATDD